MPLTRSFPIDQGFPTALDLRRLDAGLIVREGILADPITVAPAGIAFGAGGFNVSAQPFVAALKRGGAAYSLGYGVARLANDAAGAAWTIPAAPVSNSRIDLLWIRATDPGSGEATSGTDGPGGVARAVPVFGVTSGTAAVTPVAPALPAGAFLIATVTTPSGAASIAGSTIVQSYGFAQLSGGTVYARTLALLPTTAVEGDAAIVLGTGVRYERFGGAWIADSEVFTNAITLSAGYTAIGQTIRRQGLVVNLTAIFTRSIPFSGSDLVGTINVPALRPPQTIGSTAENIATLAVCAARVSTTAITIFPVSGTAGASGQLLSVTYLVSA